MQYKSALKLNNINNTRQLKLSRIRYDILTCTQKLAKWPA